MTLELHELTLSAVIDETADARSFVFEVPAALRDRYHYRAGQFLTFEIVWQDFAIRRCYSLCSAPETDTAHRVTVKRVAGGRMSSWMLDRLRVGDSIRVGTPEGRFVLDPQAGDRKLVLYAAGSGITPVLSLLKSALATTARPVTLIYANRDVGSVIFARELAALQRAWPARLALHQHLDSDGGPLTETRLRPLIADCHEGEHYVCGPAAFMDLVEQTLEAAGVSPAQVFFERFVSPVDPDRRADAKLAALPVAEAPATFTLRLRGNSYAVPYTPGLSLLAAAQQHGVRAPSSCEDGYCGSCMAGLVSGDVRMRACKALSDRDVARGKILLCQAVPVSAAPLEVDFDRASFRAAVGTRAVQAPLRSRVLAGVGVALVLTLFFYLRLAG